MLEPVSCTSVLRLKELSQRYWVSLRMASMRCAMRPLGSSAARGKRGETIYQCQCDCGKITNVFRTNLIKYKTLSCGCSKISKGEFLIEQLLYI